MTARSPWTVTARPTDLDDMPDADVVLQFAHPDDTPDWTPVTIHLTRDEASHAIAALMGALGLPDQDAILKSDTVKPSDLGPLMVPPVDPRIPLLEDLVGASREHIAALERNIQDLRWPAQAAAHAAYGLTPAKRATYAGMEAETGSSTAGDNPVDDQDTIPGIAADMDLAGYRPPTMGWTHLHTDGSGWTHPEGTDCTLGKATT